MRAERFRDRTEAGRILAARLKAYGGRRDVVVFGLPRGGVVVAYEIAEALGAPLDVFVVRKLGVPGHAELAFGAIASGGARVLNDEVVEAAAISAQTIEQVTQEQEKELARRERLYRGDRPSPELRGRTVVLVDDGLATGATMRAAVAALRQAEPARIVVAVPTGAPSSCARLVGEVDELLCERTPDPFYAVGLWYEDFSEVTDDDVRELLERAPQAEARSAS